MKHRSRVAIACLLTVVATSAYAGGGSGLPWEAPLQTLADSLTGPVAFALGLIGMVVAGGMLLWGGELSDWARRIVIMVLAVSVIINAAALFSTLFGVSAALGV